MNILVTNDDGYQAKGIRVLAEMMRRYGDVYVVAPKTHQSGMSMAVSLGFKAIRYKEIMSEPGICIHEGEKDTFRQEGKVQDRESDGCTAKGSLTVAYLDATPASCVKYALDSDVSGWPVPDVVVSGINHGSNAASASCYSGTLGAAQEAALCGIPAIGVSLDTLNPEADFSAVEKYFPGIFRKLTDNIRPDSSGGKGTGAGYGIYYNVNFPDMPVEKIRGIRIGHQGKGHWIKEFTDWDPSFYSRHGITPEMLGQESSPVCGEGEKLYMMVGTFVDDPRNDSRADHHLMQDGYISIVAHNIDTTDYAETARLGSLGFDTDF